MRRSTLPDEQTKCNMPLVWAVLSGLVMAVLPFLIPGLRSLLGLVPLTFAEWMEVGGIALGLLAVVEVGKVDQQQDPCQRLITQ